MFEAPRSPVQLVFWQRFCFLKEICLFSEKALIFLKNFVFLVDKALIFLKKLCFCFKLCFLLLMFICVEQALPFLEKLCFFLNLVEGMRLKLLCPASQTICLSARINSGPCQIIRKWACRSSGYIFTQRHGLIFKICLV